MFVVEEKCLQFFVKSCENNRSFERPKAKIYLGG